MKKIAVFPGSFDPITLGHESIVKRAIPLFDEVIIAIGVNSDKQYMFPLEKRLEWIDNTFSEEPTVKSASYEGLTVDFCKSVGANYLIRGLRSTVDFEFEKTIALMNREIDNSVETVFLMSSPELSAINSTVIRDIIRNGGDASKFVPNGIDIG